MNPEQFKEVTLALDDELRTLFAKFGFEMISRRNTQSRAGIVKYSIALKDVTPKPEVKKHDGVEDPEVDADAIRWERNAKLHGLPTEALYTEFVHGRKRFKIVGWRAGRAKKKVVVENGGIRYALTPEVVSNCLAAQKQKEQEAPSQEIKPPNIEHIRGLDLSRE